MTYNEINKCISIFKSKAKRLGTLPGQIFTRSMAFTNILVKEGNLSQKNANYISYLLITNGYLEFKDGFYFLTEKGYSLINEDVPLEYKIYLVTYISNGTPVQKFYQLWDLIGNDKDNNPFYVDGPLFYNTIKELIVGIPPQYGQYIEDLKEKGESISRLTWCKKLFLTINEDEIPYFLNILSVAINKRNTEKNSTQSDDIDNEIWYQLNDTQSQSVTQNDSDMNHKSRQPKIFISHNTKDVAYAKALVNMLSALGIDEEQDIFCSSVPGCGVVFGDDFIETIREQYEKYELIMLFIHSPRYYQSHVSLCEMGAAWITKSDYRSFLTADCEFGMLDAVVPSTKATFKAGQANTYHLLNDFKDFIEGKFGLKQKGSSRWEAIKSDFINATVNAPIV